MCKLSLVSAQPGLNANGPAIKGGCVTRRSIRAGSSYPAPAGPQSCHGARRVWRTFCRPGTSFIDHYACRGTILIDETELSRRNKCYKRVLAQCRDTSCLGTKKLSRCRIIIASRCAYPGTRTITKLSWEQEQKQKV
jgi:hypothetical protein